MAAKPNSEPTGLPAIRGPAQVGEILTVDPAGIEDADGLDEVSFAYQWIRNDGMSDTDIRDATDSTYTLEEKDASKTIKVRVSFTDDDDNQEALTSESTVVVVTKPGAPRHLNVFPHDAEALDVYWEAPATDGGSSITGYKVQWKESADSWDTAAEVSEETVSGTTHTITGLTGGVEYTVRVLAVNDVGESPPSAEASETPQEVPIWSATLTVGTAEKFAGYTTFMSKPGANILGALSSDTITVDDASHTVRALGVLDGKLILTLTPKMTAGFVLVVGTAEFASTDASTREAYSLFQFQWSDPGLDWSDGEQVAVSMTMSDNTPATGAPTISGTPQVDETLTAGTSAIVDADGLTNVSYRYQWIAGESDIDGATGSTYTLKAADQGKSVKVRVSFTDDADNSESLSSAATVAVAARPDSTIPETPLTVSLENAATTHNGTNAFTFEIRVQRGVRH